MSAMARGPAILPSIRRPEEILALTPTEADALLDQLEADVPQRAPFLSLPASTHRAALVFGDTHGDWRSTADVVERFLAAPTEQKLVGLGDYVDRSPDDCGEGSVANALWLLQLAAAFPDQVYLLQGNHETTRRIPALPHDLPEEVDLLWGPEADRYHRIVALLERGPVALQTANGAYLAHAGFPRGPPPDWRARLGRMNDDTLLDLVWSDCAASRAHRGILPPFEEAEFDRFLAASGARIFLRGHDPDLTGRPVFHGHLLTLHTTRHYERFGGVIFASLPLDRPVASVSELSLFHATSEGRVYA
jgi:hypothetical protein